MTPVRRPLFSKEFGIMGRSILIAFALVALGTSAPTPAAAVPTMQECLDCYTHPFGIPPNTVFKHKFDSIGNDRRECLATETESEAPVSFASTIMRSLVGEEDEECHNNYNDGFCGVHETICSGGGTSLIELKKTLRNAVLQYAVGDIDALDKIHHQVEALPNLTLSAQGILKLMDCSNQVQLGIWALDLPEPAPTR